MDTSRRLRIVLLGYVVRGPLAGPTWHHLQYLLGLRELGHDVWYLEDSTDYPFCFGLQEHLVIPGGFIVRMQKDMAVTFNQPW